MSKNLVAQSIVDEILNDLRDRRGFRHLLESIELEDPQTYNEIRDTLVNKVAEVLEKEDM